MDDILYVPIDSLEDAKKYAKEALKITGKPQHIGYKDINGVRKYFISMELPVSAVWKRAKLEYVLTIKGKGY